MIIDGEAGRADAAVDAVDADSGTDDRWIVGAFVWLDHDELEAGLEVPGLGDAVEIVGCGANGVAADSCSSGHVNSSGTFVRSRKWILRRAMPYIIQLMMRFVNQASCHGAATLQIHHVREILAHHRGWVAP